MVDYKELDELCRQNIEDYDEKVSMAWGYMDRMRCPLWMAFTVTAGKDSHKTDIRVVAWKAINRRKDKMNAEICWRRASAGTKLSGDSLIKYDADPDARLGRCMIHDGWYIPTSEIIKYI